MISSVDEGGQVQELYVSTAFLTFVVTWGPPLLTQHLEWWL